MLTEQEIEKGLDSAYKKAGQNAYFGNGFRAGLDFALKALNTQNTAPNSEYKSPSAQSCKGCKNQSNLYCNKCSRWKGHFDYYENT